MSKMSNSLGWFLGIAIAGVSVSGHCVHAQITSDGTLPNNSTINVNGNIFNITGGTQAGSNLFHSFRDFSVLNGQQAHFNNAIDIQNIISRVTGSSVSNIDGLIKVLQGNANLFLLNPNGIVFGPNARLNIGGSFVASTANSIKFADGFEFSAKNAQSTPLLTVSVPLGLQFGANPQRIQVQGDGQGIRRTDVLEDTQNALRVQPNQTLALVGGEISLEGATLKTAGGRIELGSVSGEGLVSLTPINTGFSLGYGGVQNFGNIELSKQATVDASGAGAGDMRVIGRQISLTNGSTIEASTLGSQSGGSLVVNALELLQVIGTSSDGQIRSALAAIVYPGVNGAGGELMINTGVLLVRDGAMINTSTLGSGKAGDLTVNAPEAVQVIGVSANGPSLLSARTYNKSATAGAGGNLTINTGTLLLRDAAQISATTYGAGKAGNLTVNATKGVQLIGTTVDGQFGSGLYAQADRGSTGAAGDLTINTTKLLVQDGAEAAASTFGTGDGGNLAVNASDGVLVIGTGVNGIYSSIVDAQANRGATGSAGNLTINTPELIVRDGGQVGTTTAGPGKGGNLTVNATKRVLVTGTDANGNYSGIFSTARRTSTGVAGNLTVNTGDLIVQDGAEVNAGTDGAGKGGNLTVNASRTVTVRGTDTFGFPSALATASGRASTGAAGDLTINTRVLQVLDGAGVFVRSLGKGSAGNLKVNARSIRLDNNAILTADTRSNNTDPNQEQATISLRALDLILSRNSNITTNATGENVIGGNINIDTDVLAAVENSNITANSGNFRGGKVRINTEGIFRSPDSDITATGASPELSGTVQINRSDIDPSLGLVELPTVLADTSKLIADTSCDGVASTDADTEKSKFTITGRGGLPPSPNEPLSTDVVWSDTRTSAIATQQQARKAPAAKPPFKAEVVEIVPATGWVFNGKGQVTLISHASNANGLKSTPTSCPKQ